MRPAFLLLAALAASGASAAPTVRAEDAPEAAIEQRLRDWTEAFNSGRADGVCDLFSHALVAYYRGQPEKRYGPLCDALREAVAKDGPRTFRYVPEIEEILVSGDLATVSLLWHLTVRDRATGTETRSTDRGLDVFRREADGAWRIVRYIGYETP